MFELIGQALASGIAIGSVYALVAAGLGITFGLFGVINFAHTQNLMLAAITAYIAASAGANYGVALLAGMVVAAAFGALTERVLIRPLLNRDAAQVETLFITLGLAIVIENVTLLMFGSQPHYFVGRFYDAYHFSGVTITTDRLYTILIAAIVFVTLNFVASHTRFGKAALATAQNPTAARVIGIPVEAVRAGAFAIGCGLAGLGGVLWSTTYSVSFMTGGGMLILSFVIVVMSGPGNINGILVCSLLLGLTESAAGIFFDPKWQRVAVLVVFLVVIITRPNGLGQGKLARTNG